MASWPITECRVCSAGVTCHMSLRVSPSQIGTKCGMWKPPKIQNTAYTKQSKLTKVTTQFIRSVAIEGKERTIILNSNEMYASFLSSF